MDPKYLQWPSSIGFIYSTQCSPTHFFPHHSPPLQTLCSTNGNATSPAILLHTVNILVDVPDLSEIDWNDGDNDSIAEYSNDAT